MTIRTRPEQINRLILSQQFTLLKYMEQNYVSSKMFDAEFATKASADLGFQITAGNIQGCREALGMKSNRDLQREESKRPKNRLEEIEARLVKLEELAKELGWKV